MTQPEDGINICRFLLNIAWFHCIHTVGSKVVDWPERTYQTENVVTVVEHGGAWTIPPAIWRAYISFFSEESE
jgi:hypothetical protein